jgi:hypothetical protein
MTEDRVALHQRMALAKWEGYAKALERNHVTFGDEFIYAPDAVIMCPLFNGGAAQSIAELFSDEVAAAAASHAPDGDILTPEWRMWWKHMPDYSLVSPFECIAAEWGFAAHDTYRGDARRRDSAGAAGVGLYLDQRGRTCHSLGLVR